MTQPGSPVPIGGPRQPVAADPERSIWSYLSVLVAHPRLVLWVPAAALVVTILVSLVLPRQFVASAAFLPQDQASQQVGQLTQIAAQLGLAMPRSSGTSPQFYEDLLMSREVLRDVVTNPYHVAGKVPFTGTLVDYFGIGRPDADQRVILAVDRLKKILSAETDRAVGIVRFSVRTRSPELSRAIVDRLLELVNNYNLERLQSQARAEREFVEGRLAAARDDLDLAENALEAFLQRNRLLNSPDLVAEEGRLQRQVSFRQQIYVTLAQSHEMAKIDEVRNTPVITVVERPEGFVEPQGRHLVIRGLTALLVAGVLSVALAFVDDSLRRWRVLAAGDYRNLEQLWRGALERLRRRWPPRPAA